MKKKNLVLSLMIISSMLISSTAYAAESVAVPSDIKGSVYEEAVKTLMSKEIITGDTDGNFHPETNLTRAQACIIVVKTMNPPSAEVVGTATQPVVKSGFTDMNGYGWAEGYVGYAVKHGVTKGYSDGTFKPGKTVTMNELITMVIRAAGYTDSSLGGIWPTNYIAKAAELNLLANIPEPLPANATKGMAAQVDYNALDKIEAANPPGDLGQGSYQIKPDAVPQKSEMIYASGSFNSTMTTFHGKTISDDVTVYTFGEKKSYSSTMLFSSKKADYNLDTVYKFKNVSTPAFYKLENGRITEMVLPKDVGFSGRAYSVINGTVSTINVSDETVIGLNTLTATKEITWLGRKALPGIPLKADYLQGELYELNLSEGEIQSIFNASDANKKGAAFKEVSAAAPGFVEIQSYLNGVAKITPADGGAMFAVKDNASIYVLDSDNPTEYSAGKASNIKANVQIRAYDISDDDDLSADIVIILK